MIQMIYHYFYCFLHKFVSKTFFPSPLHVAQHFGHSAHFTFHNLKFAVLFSLFF